MDAADERRSELWDLSVAELVERVLAAEDEREELVRLVDEAARMPLCGRVLGDVSCQLIRGHDGLHAWGSADEQTVIRWG